MFNLPDPNCPRLGCNGVMLWDEWDGCFKCSICSAEIWEEPDQPRKVSRREARAALRSDIALKNRIRKYGGSKKAGRKRKKPVKILMWRYGPNE